MDKENVTHTHTDTHTHTHTHTHRGILFIRKEEGNPAFCATWIDFEHISLSEISQTEKDKYCMFSLVWNLKRLNS